MTAPYPRLPLLALAIAAAAAGSVHAQTAEQFYPGKSLTMMVGYPPGGAYDVYARLIANRMGEHLPGKPTFVVKNRPGAASLASVNELYGVSPRDGTVIATFARSVAMDRLLGRQGTNFVPTELNWIGSANNEVSLCSVWHTVGITSIDDFMSRPIVFGANAAGSESDVFPTILNNLLGAKFKIVTGYPGANDLSLAMERARSRAAVGGRGRRPSRPAPTGFATRNSRCRSCSRPRSRRSCRTCRSSSISPRPSSSAKPWS